MALSSQGYAMLDPERERPLSETVGDAQRQHWQAGRIVIVSKDLNELARRGVDQPYEAPPFLEIRDRQVEDGVDTIIPLRLEHYNTRLILRDNPEDNRVEYSTTKYHFRGNQPPKTVPQTRELIVTPKEFTWLKDHDFPFTYTPEDIDTSEDSLPFILEGETFHLRKNNTRLKQFKHRQYNHIEVWNGNEPVILFPPEPMKIFKALKSFHYPRDYDLAAEQKIMRQYEEVQAKRQRAADLARFAEELA
jgi:hypothetical protein